MSVFKIRMGIPGMRDFWNELLEKEKSGNISSEEKDLLTSLFKSIKLLHTNPRHPSLKTHEIKDLSKKYKIKVWQDRKSTRLNSSHVAISYDVFCLKKKK